MRKYQVNKCSSAPVLQLGPGAAKGNFTTIKKSGMRLIVRDEYKDALLKLGIEDIEGLLKKPGVRVIDDVDKSVVVSLSLEGPEGRERIAVKRYDKPSFKRKLKDIFRASKAMREWKIGNRLWEKGIPVALPLAVGERRRWRVLRDSFLISREIEGVIQLRKYIFALRPPRKEEVKREKKELFAVLAGKLWELHERGCFHGDLNTSHILVRRGPLPEFYFVDFESSRWGKVSLRQRIKDLARLNESMPSFINRTDRVRFFQVYSERLKSNRGMRKRTITTIETRTRVKSK